MLEKKVRQQSHLTVHDLGLTEYRKVWRRMREFTDGRTSVTPDELWLTEHHPVFTLGQAGKKDHFLLESTIPVVHSDRGGQVTYHGPGQIVGYVLVDLKRAKISVHDFVCMLEQSMIDTLAYYDVKSSRIDGNPGVYAGFKKIGSLGLRVRRGCTYHGISLNVDMDLTPFDNIDPCGIPGMNVTQMADFTADAAIADVRETFAHALNELWQGTRL